MIYSEKVCSESLEMAIKEYIDKHDLESIGSSITQSYSKWAATWAGLDASGKMLSGMGLCDTKKENVSPWLGGLAALFKAVKDARSRGGV